MNAPRRILVVEDEPDLREAVCLTLEGAGYEALSAEDGDAALRRLADSPRPDAVLVDVLMPGMDGAQLIARLRQDERLEGVRVGLMTGIASGLVTRLVEADAFLFKPFSGRELLDAVAVMLAPRDRT